MKNTANKLLEMWRAIAFGLVLAGLIGVLLFWNLGQHPSGLSSEEATTVHMSQSLHGIFNSPLDAPLTVSQHIINIFFHGVAADRAISAIFATLAIILFFLILRFWQDTRTALLGAALFGTSSWLLHVARLDTSDVLSLAVVVALAIGLWMKHTFKRNFALLVCAVVAGVLLYIPGMVWFVLIGMVWMNRDLRHELKRTNVVARVVSAILFLVIIAPLTIAFAKHPLQILSMFGLPKHFAAISVIGRSFLHVPLWLLWRGPASDPTRWLGTTPVLNVFEIIMLILGVYSFWKHRQLGRSKAVLGGILVSWILIAMGGPVSLTLLLPFLYIAIAGGVLYMFETWFSVFPANPLARATGTIVLAAACLLSCNYHLQNYFVAWQHSPTTKAAFTQKPPAF